MKTVVLSLDERVSQHLEELAKHSDGDESSVITDLVEHRHASVFHPNAIPAPVSGEEAAENFLRLVNSFPRSEGEPYRWRREDAYDHPTRPDSNVLIYSFDSRDPVKQQIA